MQTLLPAHNIIQLKAPAKEGESGGAPYGEVLTQRDGGGTHSQATGTLRRLRRVLGEANEKIGEAQFVHYPSTELRSQSQNALVGPFILSRPRGRVSVPGIREAAFVRVAHEDRLAFTELEIRPDTELIYVCGAGIDSTQRSKVRCKQVRADNGALLGAFKSTKEKSTILTDGASECQAKLPALKERIGVERVPLQRRVRGEMVVPEKEETGAMEFVAAGTSCDIYGSACSSSSTQIKVYGRDLKFLHRFLREAHGRPAISDFHDAATVYGNAGCAPVLAYRGAQQGNQRAIVACPRRLLRPRLEFG